MRSRTTRGWAMPHLLPRLQQGALGRSGMRLAMLVLVLITLSLLVNFGEQVVQSARMERQKAELAAEVARLKAENAQLSAAADYAESDVAVERQARELLGYAREGDTVLLTQLPPPQPVSAPAPAPVALAPEPPVPNWLGWWHALFPTN